MTSNNDEALARALQTQFEQETANQLHGFSNNGDQNGDQVPANSSRRSRKNKKDERSKKKKKKKDERKRGSNRQRDEEMVETPFVPPVDTSRDTELAQKLAMELQDEQMARQIERQEAEEHRQNLTSPNPVVSPPAPVPVPLLPPPPPVAPHDAPHDDTSRQIKRQGSVNTAPTARSRSSSFGSPGVVVPPDTFIDISDDVADLNLDMELARKLDQEQRDEALAYRINQRENARTTVQGGPVGVAPGPRWTVKRCLAFTLPLIVLVAIIGALAYVFGFSGDSGVPSLPGGGVPPIFEDIDPFEGLDGTESRWNNMGPGLTLDVLDATDDSWTSLFDVAVSEWDNGNPDVLTLVPSRIAEDSRCAPVNGKLKVCNGNYGNTQWRGINQVLLSNGYIVNSVAKLNEFYLAPAEEAQRQYTMCHEIGHGFGLPHTDENFYNRDLGDCMDYTSRPANNKSPNTRNFEALAELYGIPEGRKLLRQQMPKLPSDIWSRYDEAVKENLRFVTDGGESEQPLKFPNRRLHRTEHTHERLIDLGDGCVLKMSMLVADH